MPELILNAIKDLLREELAPIKTGFKQLDGKADRTSVLVANMVEDFHNLPAILKQIQKILNSHTSALDTVVKNTNNWQTEMTTMRGQIERQEKAIKLLAEKLNLDVENILH